MTKWICPFHVRRPPTSLPTARKPVREHWQPELSGFYFFPVHVKSLCNPTSHCTRLSQKQRGCTRHERHRIKNKKNELESQIIWKWTEDTKTQRQRISKFNKKSFLIHTLFLRIKFLNIFEFVIGRDSSPCYFSISVLV